MWFANFLGDRSSHAKHFGMQKEIWSFNLMQAVSNAGLLQSVNTFKSRLKCFLKHVHVHQLKPKLTFLQLPLGLSRCVTPGDCVKLPEQLTTEWFLMYVTSIPRQLFYEDDPDVFHLLTNQGIAFTSLIVCPTRIKVIHHWRRQAWAGNFDKFWDVHTETSALAMSQAKAVPHGQQVDQFKLLVLCSTSYSFEYNAQLYYL